MAGKKSTAPDTSSKKAQGRARKAEAAASKQRAKDAAEEATEAEKWKTGARDTSKAEAARAKQEDAARKKAEKAALVAAEEASLPSKAKGTSGGKKAEKKDRKGTLDLGQLDDDDGPRSGKGKERGKQDTALYASNIDDALDALSLTSGAASSAPIERHPERRFRAAYAAFEERRLAEMKDDTSLRRQQKIDIIRKEFDKSEENPFNARLVAKFDSTKEEIKELKEREREGVEGRLAGGQAGPQGGD